MSTFNKFSLIPCSLPLNGHRRRRRRVVLLIRPHPHTKQSCCVSIYATPCINILPSLLAIVGGGYIRRHAMLAGRYDCLFLSPQWESLIYSARPVASAVILPRRLSRSAVLLSTTALKLRLLHTRLGSFSAWIGAVEFRSFCHPEVERARLD